MKVYIMRHGETVWNKVGIIQGRSNNRLSKFGIEKVKEQSLKFKEIPIDLIISSPLMRTMQTSNIMNSDRHCKIIKDDRIIEIDQGIFSKRKKASMSNEDWQAYNTRSDVYGMENNEGMLARLENFVKDLRNNYKLKYNSILIVTHRATAKMLYSLLNNQSVDQDYLINLKMFDNAEIHECEV